ncbi:metal-dependent hydrolase [Pseudomonas borbori]
MLGNATDSRETLSARRFNVRYDEQETPRIWVNDDVFLTHWLNAYSMTIPDGETFIVQTIKKFLERIEDPTLLQQARGLIGQELSHSRGHEQFLDALERQGFKLRTFRRVTRFISFKLLTPTSTPRQQLAFVVGVERINELFAEITLGSGKLARCDAHARALYEWHFAEEIEHKAVAFDVYKAVEGNRFWLGYGVVMAYLVNMSYLALACATFLRQDGQLFRIATWRRAFRYFFRDERFLPRMTRGCLEVLKRDFHPAHSDNYALAEHVLSRRVIRVDMAETQASGG